MYLPALGLTLFRPQESWTPDVARFFSIQLAKIGHSVIGIDMSRASLRCALELARPEKIDFQVILADNRAFTYTLFFSRACGCTISLSPFPKVNRAIQEISYVIKYGGLFLHKRSKIFRFKSWST